MTRPCAAKSSAYLKAAGAVSQLKGQTYGVFGGRPLGMYTAVANLDQWQRLFGVDIEHVEQEDLVRYAAEVPAEKVDAALRWLEKYVGAIKYDGKALTPEKLKLQIRSYYAARAIIAKRDLDFVGFKAHGDLTDHFVTMDMTEAFLNDPYDWDGPHEPIVAATEADMDAALTMQIFKLHLRGNLALRRRAPLRRGGRRLVFRQLRHARHLLRRRLERPGGEPQECHLLPGSLLLSGRRRLGTPFRRTGQGDAGPPGAQERAILAGR